MRRCCWPTCSASTEPGSCSSTTSTRRPPGRFEALVSRRAHREPLQHLTGRAWFRHVELVVGPGVFVPRPETELLAGWAIEQAGAVSEPVVVDLGTGSGAIAKSVADEVPAARVHAVEVDELAHRYATLNLAGTGVDLRLGDLAAAFEELAGTVDVVVSNPPYIPLDAWESVALEARDHDPADGALVGRRRPRRDPGRGRPGRDPAANRGCDRRRARGRAGRIGARGVRRCRPVGRRTRPPRPGRSAAICHGPAGTMSAVDDEGQRVGQDPPVDATGDETLDDASADPGNDPPRDPDDPDDPTDDPRTTRTTRTTRRTVRDALSDSRPAPTTAARRPSPRPAARCSAASSWCCRPTRSTAWAPTPSTPTRCRRCSTPRAGAERCPRLC